MSSNTVTPAERALERADIEDRLTVIGQEERVRRRKIGALWLFVAVCCTLTIVADQAWILLSLWPFWYLYTLQRARKEAMSEIASLEARLAWLTAPGV